MWRHVASLFHIVFWVQVVYMVLELSGSALRVQISRTYNIARLSTHTDDFRIKHVLFQLSFSGYFGF